jgi:hypothetical protein
VSNYCLLALNKTVDKALHVQGTADILADGCAVHSNSKSKEGLYQNGSAKATAESFCVTGDYSGAPGSFSPKPRRSCPIEEDPLASKFAAALAAIDTSSCIKAADNPSPVKADTALKPGVFCGGFKIFKGTVTMAPGVYVFRDGEFEVRAGATLKGEGVTILLAGNSSTRFINQGGANIDLSAPATGPFAGIVMAQLPDSIPSKENTITGGGLMDIDGIVYLPKQPLSIEGNGVIGDTTSQFAIMADTVSVQGTGLLTIRVTSDYQAAGLPELPESHETDRLAY